MIDYITKTGSYKLSLQHFSEGFCLVYSDEDDQIHIPLDMRELVELRSQINLAIDDLQNENEDPFNPSW